MATNLRHKIGIFVWKHDVILKTGNTQHITTPSEGDKSHGHKRHAQKFGEVRPCVFETSKTDILVTKLHPPPRSEIKTSGAMRSDEMSDINTHSDIVWQWMGINWVPVSIKYRCQLALHGLLTSRARRGCSAVIVLPWKTLPRRAVCLGLVYYKSDAGSRHKVILRPVWRPCQSTQITITVKNQPSPIS